VCNFCFLFLLLPIIGRASDRNFAWVCRINQSRVFIYRTSQRLHKTNTTINEYNNTTINESSIYFEELELFLDLFFNLHRNSLKARLDILLLEQLLLQNRTPIGPLDEKVF